MEVLAQEAGFGPFSPAKGAVKPWAMLVCLGTTSVFLCNKCQIILLGLPSYKRGIYLISQFFGALISPF